MFSKNYGITDVKEGIHYLSSTTSYRYSYLNLITDDIYCANNFNNYINNNIIAKTTLYTDGLIFNYELSSYLDIGTYIKNETPGIKKCKTMLKEFLEANKKYSSNQVFNNANLTAKYLKT